FSRDCASRSERRACRQPQTRLDETTLPKKLAMLLRWLPPLVSSGISVGVRLARLPADLGTVLECLQHPARPGDNFRTCREARSDFNVGLAGDAGGDFHKLHFVCLVQGVHALD